MKKIIITLVFLLALSSLLLAACQQSPNGPWLVPRWTILRYRRSRYEGTGG